MEDKPTRRAVAVGGHLVSVQEAGSPADPTVLLLHGMVSDGSTWQPVIGRLAARGLHVVAPDLLGHGESAKPRIAYSHYLFTDLVNDLMAELGIASATVAGHSLGGAVAMNLAYERPGTVERLVVISSGGLGKQVHPMLRAATLPGAKTVLGLALNRRTGSILGSARLHERLRLPPEMVVNLGRAGRNLVTPEARGAFITTVRSVIEPAGQRGSMIELDYLGTHVPTLIVWSEHDHVIPARHAHDLHEHLPGSRLELFPGASHEPHRRYAERFTEVVADFIATSEPARESGTA